MEGPRERGLFELPIHQSYILDNVVDGEAFRIRFTDSGGLSVYDKVNFFDGCRGQYVGSPCIS